MYAEFLKSLLVYIEALNKAAHDSDIEDEVYVDRAPVFYSQELVGFIFDDIGGVYHYEEATGPEKEWWDKRPWKRS